MTVKEIKETVTQTTSAERRRGSWGLPSEESGLSVKRGVRRGEDRRRRSETERVEGLNSGD